MENQKLGALTEFSAALEVQRWADSKKNAAQQSRAHNSEAQNIPQLLKQLVGADPTRLAAVDVRVLEILDFENYAIHKILFQSLPSVYIPANLYVPAGQGKFPAVLNSHGHWEGGKTGEIVQQTAQLLAKAGYVVLCMDAWGAGERGTAHRHEYHGAHLGGSLLAADHTLLGFQLLDNLQGVNVLCALDFVDPGRIAAVGASGGGNQTMWLSALDARIKAAVLAVSVGTFSSYILESNCMCELLPGGLSQIEASEVIASIAPRAVKVFSASREQIPAFQIERMKEVFNVAQGSFKTAGFERSLSYEIFDTEHDFSTEMLHSMHRFLDGQLNPSTTATISALHSINPKKLHVLSALADRRLVMTTRDFMRRYERQVEDRMMAIPQIGKSKKIQALSSLLKVQNTLRIVSYREQNDPRGAKNIWLKTNDEQTIVLLANLHPECKTITLVLSADFEESLVPEAGYMYVDLFGLNSRHVDQLSDQEEGLPEFHTLARTFLWFGENLMGRWVAELKAVLDFLTQQYKSANVHLVAYRELSLAALFYSVLYGAKNPLTLKEFCLDLSLPECIDNARSLSMAVHIPGFLEWGGVPLLTALTEAPITMLRLPVNLGGDRVDERKIALFSQQVEKLKDKIIS